MPDPLLNGGLGLALKSCAYWDPQGFALLFFQIQKEFKIKVSTVKLPSAHCFPWENQCFL